MYVGMAAGVGKTYTMLEEGQDRRRDGEDVVIGWLETHGRAETAAMAEGLEVVPPLEVEHRGVPLRDMDVDAVIARAPEIALVDELAHTNAPGMARAKRYEDVQVLQLAGIDVISTVNVQHLESLNDRILELTGVRVRETIPDQVAPRRRRGRARRPDARGVAGAPEGWEGVPPGSGRGGPAELLHHRQSRDPPRGGPPRGGRLGGRAREARHARPGRRPAGRPGAPRRAGDGGRAARARRAAPDPRRVEGRAAAGRRAGHRDAGGAPG